LERVADLPAEQLMMEAEQLLRLEHQVKEIMVESHLEQLENTEQVAVVAQARLVQTARTVLAEQAAQVQILILHGRQQQARALRDITQAAEVVAVRR
jgi:hypothetical protein